HRIEFVSLDDRFAYDFGGYAGSVDPIRIWTYDRGRLRDTTRRFPRQVARDAARLWHHYLRSRGTRNDDSRGILAAWAAEEYMLGDGAAVWPALERALRRGDLGRCEPGGGCYEPYGTAYIRALRRLLRKTGYT